MRPVDIVDDLAANDEVLMGQIAQPHAHVVEHVVPFPAALGGDDGAPVEEIVEHTIPVRIAQRLVGREDACLTVVRHHLVVSDREVMRVLMERDHHQPLGQILDASLLIGVQRQQVRLVLAVALDELELAEVARRLQVVE